MKTLIALSMLLSLSAFAKKADSPISLECASDMGTTTFELQSRGEGYHLDVWHLNGVAFMPIHEGVIVPHDFPYLQNKANFLTKMGDHAEFKFPKDSCRIDGPGLISCANGERKKFGDVEMQALNFYTAKVHESTMGLELDSWKVTLSIWSPDFVPVADVTMVYGENNCRRSGF